MRERACPELGAQSTGRAVESSLRAHAISARTRSAGHQALTKTITTNERQLDVMRV